MKNEYRSVAEPRAMIDDVPVFCTYDELLDTAEVIGNPRNPNEHPDDQVDLLARIIKSTGWRANITISKRSGYVVKGHGRLAAAIKAGIKKVPVEYQDYSSEAEEWADLTADNRLAELSEMNNTMLADLLQEIDTGEIPLELTGYTEEDFENLLSGMLGDDHGEVEDDDFDGEPPEEPTSRRGDVYQLGSHRLMCGDSTDADDMAKLMNGVKADIAFTSPPYNAGSLDIEGNETTKRKYNSYDDDLTEDEYFEFISVNMAILLNAANEVFYNIGLVENNKRSIIKLQNAYIEQFKDIIYWEKSTAAPHITPGVVNNLVEFILCFGDGHRKFQNAQFSQGTYWNVIKGPNAAGNEYSDIHKATFPLYLPANIVENFTPEGGSVLDCFGGTGTTMVACEQLGRSCYMMELDPKYVDVIIERWEKLTGEKAQLLERAEYDE